MWHGASFSGLGNGPRCIGFAVYFAEVLCICHPWLRLCRRLMALPLSPMPSALHFFLWLFGCFFSHSFYHCHRSLRHIGYLDHFIRPHHLHRHHFISRHHGPFIIVASIVIASPLSLMSLSVGILVVWFINLHPHSRIFTLSFIDISSHTHLCFHCFLLFIVFLLCNVWLEITSGLYLAFGMCVVTTTCFFVHTISHAVTTVDHALFYHCLGMADPREK